MGSGIGDSADEILRKINGILLKVRKKWGESLLGRVISIKKSRDRKHVQHVRKIQVVLYRTSMELGKSTVRDEIGCRAEEEFWSYLIEFIIYLERSAYLGL